MVKRHGGGNARLAIDRCEPMGSFRLAELGVEIGDGQEVLEHIGEVGGSEGVKLEQQVLVTACGAEPLYKTPFADALRL
jgi:hypothetical protein